MAADRCWKSPPATAASASASSESGSGLARIHQPDRFQHHVAADRQRLRTELVYRVLWAVPEDIVVTVVEVDDVHCRHSELQKRHVVVLNAGLVLVEVRLVAQVGGDR